MKLSEIAQILNQKFHGKDGYFKSISIDTRTIQPESLFIALQGPHFDAHNFIDQAAERGAIGAIVSRWIETTSLPQICVNDTRAALIKLGSYQRNQMKKVIVIAITGSCGKTDRKSVV